MQVRTVAPILAVLCACGGGAPAAEHPSASEPAILTDVHRQELNVDGVTGLSDLARDQDGRTWAVAERKRVALRVDRPGAAPVSVPLVGVPDELDVEGMAWIDRERVALATESDKGARTGDAVFIARLGPAGIEVVERRDLDYKIWPLDPIGNQGIEGVCRAGGSLVVAVETVIANPDERFAPVAVHELAAGRWSPFLVRLTTRTGKISALACMEKRDHSLDVMAVERHFEVARLIRFRIPAHRKAGKPPVLESVVVAELAPAMIHSENFEGLLWDGARAISLVVDNDWTTITGPNLLITAKLSGGIPEPK